jgi:hypothetical protein
MLRSTCSFALYALAFALLALDVQPALARRGLLDDEPEMKGGREVSPKRDPERREVPDVRREVPDVRRAGPREELKIPKDLSELNGCWESQSGELLVVDARTNKRVGTSRNCYCFRKDGTGVARILYTSQRNAARARGQKVCQGSMTASVRGDQLTFYHQAHLPCTDGSTFGPSGPADCKADQRVPQLASSNPRTTSCVRNSTGSMLRRGLARPIASGGLYFDVRRADVSAGRCARLAASNLTGATSRTP